jgi:dihydroflavonol-4-reductase
MDKPVTDKPVCVTGASGFVASHVVKDLLEHGYRVRGTVRDASRADKCAHLRELPGADERLELVSADLLEPSSFDAAVAGCAYVLHTASPYALDVEDPQRDLVEPAVRGTVGVLEACQRAGAPTRVIVTSSVAAITDEPTGSAVTEDDWNERSSLRRNPYYYSKVLAERAAWQFAEEKAPGFDLVVINPFVVIGPSLTADINQSNQVFVDMLTGKLPGIVNLAWGFVDVRDVAISHRLALEVAGAAGRYICANATMTMREIVELLRERGYGAYKLPKLGLDSSFGNGLIKVSSYFYGKGTGSYLRTHIGRTPRFDNRKIQGELGMTFRPIEETIVETVEDLMRWGHVKRHAAAS